MLQHGPQHRSGLLRTAQGAALALALFLLLNVTGCGSNFTQSGKDADLRPDTSYTVEQAADVAGVNVEDVEAVVNGAVITHTEVDARVASLRAIKFITGEQDFESYLASAGLSRASFRNLALKELIDEQLIYVEGKRLGVSLSDEELAARIKELEQRYPSHSKFVQALQETGYSEKTYYQAIGASILATRVREAVIGTIEPTGEQISDFAQLVAPTFAGRRGLVILIAQDNYALAQDIAAQLANGADFASLARTYSIDGSAAAGGDMGWETISSLPTAYKDILDGLEVGGVSEITHTEYGYVIIKCTDRYIPSYKDGKVQLDNIPADIMTAIKDSMTLLLQESAFDTYVSNLEATAALAVFDADGTQLDPASVGLATQVAPLVYGSRSTAQDN